ncbi:MAG TPA: threonine--tRNA ligase [Candidatus Babeliales bacterium]|jgi:threonyl-tRNA synthetase|nr:threonine--tRNA ligase [Candidatus Babeliales bacterium]
MNNKEYLKTLRHSAAHLLAHAVQELFPNTLLTIGPATDDGFFYDMLPEKNFKQEDLEPIAIRMHEIVRRNVPLTHEQMPKKQARELFAHNPFKLELIDGIPGDTVGIARQGNFFDLCRGGHVESTALLDHFVLLHLSGSYWRADRNNTPLQRIYGTIFPSAQELEEYLKRKEELAKYDHRKLGKELDLFSFHDEGVGFVFYHPKGKIIINAMTDYLKKELQHANYQEIATPIMLSDTLWRRSGHYSHYKDNMYFCTVDEGQYAIRPMNCPGAMLLYNERPRSYRQLPMRLAEFGQVHRHELSGVLHGLMRVRSFVQDDAHIFCTEDQIQHEVASLITLIQKVLHHYGFTDLQVALSTKPDNAMGSSELWDLATSSLKQALEHAQISYEIKEGNGAFYGPKIDVHIKDSMDRQWQCSTIQLDFMQPINFDLAYITPQGTKARPVMIHRAIYGSIERFFGILLEHYKGILPLWLAPIQARVLTITDAQKEYAHQIAITLKHNGMRVDVDQTSDPLAGQIKSAQLERIPWMLIVGNKEVSQKTITLRLLDGKQETGHTIESLLAKHTAI